jgi:hypothetical protein
MAYTPTNWVEGVTTLGPTNMNKIETELASLDSSVTALQTADKTVTIGASSVVSTDTNGGVTIPWGISVASVVSVVVCGGQGWGTPDVMINIDDAVPPTTTGFSIRARNTNSNTFVNGSVRVQWLACVVKP